MSSLDYFLLKKFFKDFRRAKRRLASSSCFVFEATELYRDVLLQRKHRRVKAELDKILATYTGNPDELKVYYDRFCEFIVIEEARPGQHPSEMFQDKIEWACVIYWLGRFCWNKRNDIALLFLERAVILLHECKGSMDYVNLMVRSARERAFKKSAAMKGGKVKSELHEKIRAEAIKLLYKKALLIDSWKTKKAAADAISDELWLYVQEVDPKNIMNFSESDFSYTITRWNQDDIKKAFAKVTKKVNSKK